MKLLLMLIAIGVIGIVVYVVTSKMSTSSKKHKNWKPLGIAVGVVVILLGLYALVLHNAATQPDMQCNTAHTVTTQSPTNLKTATDYFAQGDYDYDSGNCQQAVVDYTKALSLNPNYPQAYNNRAYTNMRMRNYKDALPDLNKAIELNPNYIQALMNRADIHNYYYQIDRQSAIADYRRAIALGATQKQTSVCGHLFLAKHNGWTLGAYLDFFTGGFAKCD